MKTIDLTKCKQGDKLKTRDGRIVTFDRVCNNLAVYRDANQQEVAVCTNGARNSKRDTERDIVEIIKEELNILDYKIGDRFRTRKGDVVILGALKENIKVAQFFTDTAFNTYYGSTFYNGRCHYTEETDHDIVEALQPIENKKMNTYETYLAGQKAANFQEGEYVKVAFKVPSKAAGWDADWVVDMDGCVGKSFQVLRVIGLYGVTLKECAYSFPYFCLERVEKKPNPKLRLNSEWEAEVLSNDEIKVGCQTFKTEKLRVLLQSASVTKLELNRGYVAKITPTITVHGVTIEVEKLEELLKLAEEYTAY